MKLRTPQTTAAHGGNLQDAIARFGGDGKDWLDLSSALSPWSWYDERQGGNHIHPQVVHHLPHADAALAAHIQRYYGHEGLVCAGTQAAIRVLPQCFSSGRIWVLAGTYGEHALAWQQNGLSAAHRVSEVSADAIRHGFFSEPTSAAKQELPDCLVLTNPGNPGGEQFSYHELLQWAQQLAANESWLVVDEAFMDTTPDNSLLATIDVKFPSNLIVLRSPGKFFGVAGLRVGCVFAVPEVYQTLTSQLGPWTVSGPALTLFSQMLADHDWQNAQRQRLQQAAKRLQQLWRDFDIQAATDLFVTLKLPTAALAQQLQQRMAERNIWLRCFTAQGLIRCGLPAAETDWQRLHEAIAKV